MCLAIFISHCRRLFFLTEENAIDQKSSDLGEEFFSQKSLKSIWWLIISKLITFLIYFSVSVIVVRGLSPKEYGTLSFFKSVASYLVALCALGLNISVLRFIPELMANNNLAGLKRLLSKTAILQFIAICCAGIVLASFSGQLSRWFNFDFNLYAIFALFLAGCLVTKCFFNDSLTALYQLKNVATISTLQAIIWIILISSVIYLRKGVKGVLLAEAISYLAVSAMGAMFLYRHISSLNMRSPTFGIGKSRVFFLSAPVLMESIMRSFTLQYTEIFFLGYYFCSEVVGFYDLGYSTTHMVITFLPLSVQTLFVASFAEAYAKDKTSLPNLVSGMFQILTVITVPIACFGICFAPYAISLIYGEDMSRAGPITSFFSAMHILPLINMPLSMAIIAREQYMRTLWLEVIFVVTNLILDFLLIKHFELYGAMAAVIGTFIITIPIQLTYIRKLIGGIYFPTGFFLRIFIPSIILSLLLFMIIRPTSILVLIGTVLLYGLLLLVVIKYLRLIRPDDTKRFRSIGLEKLNRIIDFFDSPR